MSSSEECLESGLCTVLLLFGVSTGPMGCGLLAMIGGGSAPPETNAMSSTRRVPTDPKNKVTRSLHVKVAFRFDLTSKSDKHTGAGCHRMTYADGDVLRV